MILVWLVEMVKNFDKMNDYAEKISSYKHTFRWI